MPHVFRPCIDLHEGQVKQIVGGSLTDDGERLQTNFTSDKPAVWYAELYRKDNLHGGHVIQLGLNNASAAREARQLAEGDHRKAIDDIVWETTWGAAKSVGSVHT